MINLYMFKIQEKTEHDILPNILRWNVKVKKQTNLLLKMMGLMKTYIFIFDFE